MRSKTIAIHRLIEPEPADPGRIRRAREMMEKARKGEGPKRPPIKFADLGDGTYRVVDGNTTLHVVRELGERTVVVEIPE